MKNLIILFFCVLLSSINSKTEAQTFSDIKSMKGHTVYFTNLKPYLAYKDFLAMYNDKGKLKIVKDNSLYPELLKADNLYSINDFVYDGKKSYLDVECNGKHYYFSTLFTFYKVARDVDYYYTEIKNYVDKHSFFDVKALNGLNINEDFVYYGRFSEIDLVSIKLNPSQNFEVIVKLGGVINQITYDNLKKYAIPNEKFNNFAPFFKKIKYAYMDKYHYIDATILKEKDDSKVILGKYYPMQITGVKADKDWNKMVTFNIDGEGYWYNEDSYANYFVSDYTVDTALYEANRIANVKKYYSNLANISYCHIAESVRGQYAYYHIISGFAFGEDGMSVFMKEAVVDTTKLTARQKNDWTFLRSAGIEAMSQKKQYKFPYDIDIENKIIKIDVTSLYEKPKKGSYARPEQFYNGPIFPEFKSYRDYESFPGELPPNMTPNEWEDFVWDATGRLPSDLTRTNEKRDMTKKYIDEKYLHPQKHYWNLSFNDDFTELIEDDIVYKAIK